MGAVYIRPINSIISERIASIRIGDGPTAFRLFLIGTRARARVPLRTDDQHPVYVCAIRDTVHYTARTRYTPHDPPSVFVCSSLGKFRSRRTLQDHKTCRVTAMLPRCAVPSPRLVPPSSCLQLDMLPRQLNATCQTAAVSALAVPCRVPCCRRAHDRRRHHHAHEASTLHASLGCRRACWRYARAWA